MDCPNCQTHNPEGARFCFNCGTSLSINCSNCGTQLVAGAKFCFNCGHPVCAPVSSTTGAPPPSQVAPSPSSSISTTLTTAPSNSAHDRLQQYIPKELLGKLEAARANRSMAGERRIVTVLFCDVKGSTALAEMLDPEEWAEIMNGAFKYLIEPIYRYEGTLARLMGDAILAFFGAPIAHEDDPQRAVLAGLDIIDGMKTYREKIMRERGFDLNVRIGINTGLVVVGEVGSDLRVEYTAMGDAVNLASRMEQTADPDTVRISGNTHKSVSNLFLFKSLGDIEVKGKSEPVPAYEVLGVREGAIPTRGIEGLSSPLVGRTRELFTLQSALDDVSAGMGRIVSLMGEAGLGKSRLVAELKAQFLNQEPGTRNLELGTWNLSWYEGRSLSYESTVPYAPFIDMFSSIFGIHSSDSDSERYDKVRAGVESLLPGHGDEVAPFIATLLNVKLDGDPRERMRYLEPPMLRGRVFHAVAQFIGALASNGPVVLLFEDLHWVDPTSLELIEALLPLTDTLPLMLFAIFRPNKQDPSWRFHELASSDHRDRYVTVSLQPLDDTESRQLVANLLEIEDLPEKVRALILSKAEGNPFFVEEVIRSLLDAKLVIREDDHWRATREIENIAVPDTLAGVITARLDRLDDESKYVAQTASVVGRDFQYDVLGEVYESPQTLDPSLATLQQRELVREKSRIPTRAYMFKHVLTQETAYSSVLLSRRREIHRRVAECLERVAPDRVNDIARHYLEARQDARALPYLIEAADREARAGARDEAIGHYRQAVAVSINLDDHASVRKAYEGLGKSLEFAMQPMEAIETYNTMLSFGEQHSDPSMQVSALNKLSYATAFMLGQMPEAEAYLSRAEEIANDNAELVGLVKSSTVRCGICTMVADFDNAAKHLENAAELGRRIENLDTTAYGLAHRANMLTHLMKFDEVYEVSMEGLQVSDAAGHLEHKANIMSYPLPVYYMHKGNLAEAYRWAGEGYTIADRIGSPVPCIMAAYFSGYIAELQGDYETALDWHRKGLQHARPMATFFPFVLVPPLGGLGVICLDISDALKDKVTEYHTEALNILKTPMGSPTGGTGWADLGFCALQLGYPDIAYQYFENGLTVPSMQMYLMKPRLLAGAALAAQALGNTDEATSRMQEACTFMEANGLDWYKPQLALLDAGLAAALGSSEQALEKYRQAIALSEESHMPHIKWQAQLGAAKLLQECGNTAESQTLLQSAQQTLNELSAGFKDPTYKEAFQENPAHQLAAQPQ